MYEHNALGYWSGLALCLTKSEAVEHAVLRQLLLSLLCLCKDIFKQYTCTRVPFNGYRENLHLQIKGAVPSYYQNIWYLQRYHLEAIYIYTRAIQWLPRKLKTYKLKVLKTITLRTIKTLVIT